MNERDVETAVLRALDATAGLGGRPVEPDRPLAEQFPLDRDAFFQALARETGVEIPPGHRGRLSTLDRCVAYLARRLSC